MDISWHGEHCFQVISKERSLVVNPINAAGLEARVVLAQNESDFNYVKNFVKGFDWPGEYEMDNIPFNAYMVGDQKVFVFVFEGVKICNLGAISEIPEDKVLNKIGDVDVLMIDLTGKYLKKEAAQDLFENIEPRVVIPMGEGDHKAHLDKESVDGEIVDIFNIKSKSALPVDQTQFIVLNRA